MVDDIEPESPRGSSLDRFLEEEGMLAEVHEAAMERVNAWVATQGSPSRDRS